jgi:hypothetical protein
LVIAILVAVTLCEGCRASKQGHPMGKSEVPVEAGCADRARWGLAVTIRTLEGNRVCDGTVEASSGAYDEQLAKDDQACTFFGACDRPGTYTIVAVAPDFEPVRAADVPVQRRPQRGELTQEVTLVLWKRSQPGREGRSDPLPLSANWKDGFLEYIPALGGAVNLGNPIVGPSPIDNADRIVAKMGGAFRSCYNRALVHDPTLSGSMRVAFDVLPLTGSADRVRIERRVGLNDELVGCITNRIGAAQFASPATGDRSTVAFSLSPSSATTRSEGTFSQSPIAPPLPASIEHRG